LITAEFKGVDNKILNNVGKNIFKKAKDAVCVLVSKMDNNFTIVVMSGPDVKDLHIGNMIKTLMTELKGKGGGGAEAANAFVPAINITANQIIEAFKAKL
jgi:alanyl-tRNA synthetase